MCPTPAVVSALPHEKRHQATHEADHEARYRDASPPSALEHFCECSHRCFHPIDSTEPVPAMRHPALVKGWFNRCGATSTKMGNRYYRCIGGRPCRGARPAPEISSQTQRENKPGPSYGGGRRSLTPEPFTFPAMRSAWFVALPNVALLASSTLTNRALPLSRIGGRYARP